MKDKLLSIEDRILWGKVARSVVPMPGRTVEEAVRDAEDFADLFEGAGPQASRTAEPSPPPAPARPRGRTQHGLDAPTRQKLARGRLPIEGKVDLHGLTQTEAHALLLSFLYRAHADGRRHVLVVTGKGSSSGGAGVLRRSVPGWLATPAFRAFVGGHEPAARHHGGEGALYVRLRRPGGGAS